MNCNNCGNVLLPSDKVCPICSTPNPNYRKKEVKSKPNTNALMVLTAIFSLIIIGLLIFLFIQKYPNLFLYLSVGTAVEFLLLILGLVFSKNSTIKASIIIPMITVLVSIVLIFLTFQEQEKNKPVSNIKDLNVVYKVNKEYLPEAICIDEFKSVKNIDGAMSFVFADYQTKNIIDIVEDRRLNSLTEYFSRFSLEARNNVKYICMDMYSPYISLVKSIFPKAEIVLDKFHIVNLVNRAFNQTRISIMNSLKDESLKRKLKLFWKLLQKYYPDLCQEPYYCPSFKYKLSTKDKVDYLLEKSSELDVNFNIYQDILQAIKHNNFKRFENIVKKNLSKKEKVSKQMLTALKTLKKYMKYIENMFESNITNGLIEGLNNKIKSIKRTAFGYSNFSNFKKRILIQAGIISISA